MTRPGSWHSDQPLSRTADDRPVVINVGGIRSVVTTLGLSLPSVLQYINLGSCNLEGQNVSILGRILLNNGCFYAEYL